MWTCIAHHFPGFWNKKEQRGQNEDLSEKTAFNFPKDSSRFLAAEPFFTEQECFVPSKCLLSAAPQCPGLSATSLPMGAGAGSQLLLRKPHLMRTSLVTKEKMAKPEAHSVSLLARLFWCQLADLVEWEALLNKCGHTIMQMGCSEEPISECLWISSKQDRVQDLCKLPYNTGFP